MKFTFYKNNKLSGMHQKSVSEILKEYSESDDSKLDMPFERNILNFMMVNYGSYARLTDVQWDELYKIKDIYLKS
jgi:hypothetical protein